MRLPPKIKGIFLEAMQCRSCFANGFVEPAYIDIAQPRWIGPSFWTSNPRILLLFINPGAGEKYAKARHSADLDLLQKSLSDPSGLLEYLERQRQNLSLWGKGKFWHFFVKQVGLDIDAIALANIAWCASRDDRYPVRMRNNCFEKFTSRLLDLLKPDIVIMSGRSVGRYEDQIQEIIPGTMTLKTLHFAHRKGKSAQLNAVTSLRTELACCVQTASIKVKN